METRWYDYRGKGGQRLFTVICDRNLELGTCINGKLSCHPTPKKRNISKEDRKRRKEWMKKL